MSDYEIKAGRVAMVYRGAWDAVHTYNTLDVVTYQNETYCATVDGLYNILPTVTTSWFKLAKIGDPAVISSQETEYATTKSRETEPTSWSTSKPTLQSDDFLWIKNTIQFNTGNPVEVITINPPNSVGEVSIGLQNATNGGLTIPDSPLTSLSGTITIGHSNTAVSSEVTQNAKVYKVEYDTNGHLTRAAQATYTDVGAAASAHASQHYTNGTDPLTPTNIGAIANPASPSASNLLKFNGDTWVASNLINTDLYVQKIDSMAIAVADWNSTTTCTKSIESTYGLTANSIIFVAPTETSGNYDRCVDNGVRCTTVATNSLTFVCDSIPDGTIYLNIVVWNALNHTT